MIVLKSTTFIETGYFSSKSSGNTSEEMPKCHATTFYSDYIMLVILILVFVCILSDITAVLSVGGKNKYDRRFQRTTSYQLPSAFLVQNFGRTYQNSWILAIVRDTVFVCFDQTQSPLFIYFYYLQLV